MGDVRGHPPPRSALLHDGRPVFLFPGADGSLPTRQRCGRIHDQFHKFIHGARQVEEAGCEGAMEGVCGWCAICVCRCQAAGSEIGALLAFGRVGVLVLAAVTWYATAADERQMGGSLLRARSPELRVVTPSAVAAPRRRPSSRRHASILFFLLLSSWCGVIYGTRPLGPCNQHQQGDPTAHLLGRRR